MTDKMSSMGLEEQEDYPKPRWYDWVEKNSMPKNYKYPRPRRELTPWQKRGPMSRRDWVHFYQWAAKNAIPRELPPPIPLTPLILPGKKKPKKKKTLSQLVDHALKLSAPKKPRQKYIIPPKPKYPYAPKISRKDPPRVDPGRPFQPPKVPKVFQHIEVEVEFWSTLRFPVVRGALKYRASANVLRLAEPKVVPPLRQHCPIPEPIEEVIPPRRKMTYKQWTEHKRRLEYLAKPIVRPYYDWDLYY